MSAGQRANFLAAMAESSAARVARARDLRSDAEIWTAAREAAPPPALTLSEEGFDVIAEFKPRSPAAGRLVTESAANPAAAGAAARTYAGAGAAAISILTEPSEFGGSLAHLEAAARASDVPVMRKDFLVDPYQIAEARAAGAGGVLLIARILDDASLDATRAAADELAMFALLEAFDGADLRRIDASLRRRPARGLALVGVNARDLATLEVAPGRLAELVAEIPAGAIRVAESGIASEADAARAAAAGYRMALVGTALMREADPASRIRALLRAGRFPGRSSPAGTA